MNEECRCGHKGEGEHPCHWNLYSCRKPAKQRFYVPHWRFALAGAQMKASASDTWACDEHWEEFQKVLSKRGSKQE